VVISVGAGLVVVLVGGQLLAPAIATTVLRHRLAQHGKVISVRVSAFPWLELLWQHADSVTARMADFNARPEQLENLLHEAGGAGKLDISVGVVHTGLLTLHNVSFSKRGDEMEGVARLELEDLRAALPVVRSLMPVQNTDGQLMLRGTASVFGVNATVDIVVAAREGKLVVAPAGLFGAFATLTLYDDPRVYIQSVGATTVPGGVRFVVGARTA